MTNHIHCPKCQHEINIESVLAERIEAEQNAKYNARLRDLDQREQGIKAEKENLQSQVRILLEQEKNKLLPQLKASINAEKEDELKNLQSELGEKSKQVADLRKQEGELLRQKRQLEEAQAGIDAEIEKRLAAEKATLLGQLKEKVENDNALALKQKDIVIEQMQNQVAEMQRKMQQGSTQLQGEAQELVIEEMLRNTHRFDVIEEIKKGENGADILQIVQNRSGQACGGILYESKNTKTFSESWVQKLKEDMLLKKADLGVIVTQAMPKGVSTFEQREENLWICSFEHLKALTFVLRAALLKVDEVKIVQANQGEKSKMLYDYLMGNDFKNQLKAVHDTFAAMHASLFKEKKASLANFKKREKEIDRIMINLSGIAGSINGISGQTVAEFAEFEVVEEETALLES
jgi:hypothetical protein